MNAFLKFIFCLLVVGTLQAEESYEFRGKHFIANYSDCDAEALCNVEGLIRSLNNAVKCSGATILNSSSYVFPGNGLTMVFLLSESHASIHTYPEHGACFIDLFTCGDVCSHETFDQVLRSYLKPGCVNQKVLSRDLQIEEILP